ncbi:MAG: glycosyltransferase, partial [Holophagales bacterium]|nr:glycosyltransferase [Holophagales bacterium]
MTEPGAKHRLLFLITTSDFGGTESFLERLVSGLDRDRFELSVCSLCPPGRIAQRIEELGIPVLDLGMHPRARPMEMLLAVPRLSKLFRCLGIELVQSLLYRANVLAAFAVRSMGRSRPVLVTGQRSLIPGGRSLDFRAQQLTRSWADRVVAVSEAVRRELLATERVAPEKVEVIQNGIDLHRFPLPAAGERDRARAAWDLDPGAIVVGAVGRLHGPKGVSHLVRALALARREDPRLVLVLAGDGPEQENLERQVEAQDLREHVRFLGFRSDPRPLYPGFDVYALPSLAEGSPNALLEAMGRGCACVASNVGG